MAVNGRSGCRWIPDCSVVFLYTELDADVLRVLILRYTRYVLKMADGGWRGATAVQCCNSRYLEMLCGKDLFGL